MAAQHGDHPHPEVPYGPPLGQDSVLPVEDTRRWALTVVAGFVVVLAVLGVVFAVNLSSDDQPEAFPSTAPVVDPTYLPGQEPDAGGVNVLSVEGITEAVDAVARATGGTTVLTAFFEIDRAAFSLTTEVDGVPQVLFWDGASSEQGDENVVHVDETPFDLRAVDPRVLVDLVDSVRRSVPGATRWRAVVSAPEAEGLRLYAEASGPSGGRYVYASPDGTVTYDSQPS